MTEAEVRGKFEELEKEAQGKDAHRWRPTLVRMETTKDGEVVIAEIRSNFGSLWKYPEGHRSRVPMGTKAVYQPTSTIGKGFDNGWRFDSKNTGLAG